MKEENKEERAKKAEVNKAEREAKALAKAAKEKVSEAWSQLLDAESALAAAKTKLNQATLQQAGVDEARDEVAEKKEDVEKARAKHAKAKELKAAGGKLPEEPKGRAGTSRQQSAAAAAAEAKEKAKKEKAIKKARAAARQRDHLQQMLRIDCLGSDHDGAHYFALPEAVESDDESDDDADDDDDAPAAPEQKKAERVRLIVESRDGSVGELSSATELKKALRTSKDERDRRLLHALSKHEALKRMGERDAGPATTKITKTTHGDYDVDGHAWIGRRVRFVDEDEGGDPVDGTVISWRPAQTAAAAPPPAAAAGGGVVAERGGAEPDRARREAGDLPRRVRRRRGRELRRARARRAARRGRGRRRPRAPPRDALRRAGGARAARRRAAAAARRRRRRRRRVVGRRGEGGAHAAGGAPRARRDRGGGGRGGARACGRDRRRRGARKAAGGARQVEPRVAVAARGERDDVAARAAPRRGRVCHLRAQRRLAPHGRRRRDRDEFRRRVEAGDGARRLPRRRVPRVGEDERQDGRLRPVRGLPAAEESRRQEGGREGVALAAEGARGARRRRQGARRLQGRRRGRSAAARA